MKKIFLLTMLSFAALSARAQVSGNFIDLTVHNAPNLATAAGLVPFGTIRAWDTGTTWMDLQTGCPSTYSWTNLDAFLNSSAAVGKDIIYTFGYVPLCISSNSTGACTQGPTGTCYPPSDLGSGNTTFSNFVTALVNHSLASKAAGHGYITYYEVWNEPNATDVGSSTCPSSCGTWFGTIAQFNAMVATEYSVIHALDPTAQLIGPGLSHSDSTSNITFLNDFLAASGSKISAVSGHHYDGFFNPIFSEINDYNDIIAAETMASLSLPVWYTEGNCAQASTNPCTTDAEKIAAIGGRYLSRLSLPVARDVFYAFDGTHGDNIWVTGTGLTPEGVAFGQLSSWLVGATGYSCTTNGNSGSTLTTWRCSLTQANGHSAQILFLAGNGAISAGTTLSVSAGAFTRYQTLGSGTINSVSGGNVTISPTPLMLLPPVSNDVYLSQSGAGGNTGADCADALAYTYFNTSGNWSGTPTGVQIGPGTTVHLCGTITGSGPGTNVLTFQGSGASGNLVTLFFESGAIIQEAYFGSQSSSAIYDNGNNFILINGGANGIIQTTLNGTSGASCFSGSCSNQQGSGSVYLTGHDEQVENLNLPYTYVRTRNSTTDTFNCGCDDGALVYLGTGTNISLGPGNTIKNARIGIGFYWGNGGSGSSITNTVFGECSTCIEVATNANGTYGTFAITGNSVTDFGPWMSNGMNRYHNQFLHAFIGNGGTTNGILGTLVFGNNNMSTSGSSNVVTDMSDLILLENTGSQGAASINHSYIFNNAFSFVNGDCVSTCSNGQLGLFASSDAHIWNNTFTCNNTASGQQAVGFGGNQATTTASYENNVIVNCGTNGGGNNGLVSWGTPAVVSLADYNLYGNGGTATGWSCAGSSGSPWAGGSAGFTSYKANCALIVAGNEAHSSYTASTSVLNTSTLRITSGFHGNGTNLTAQCGTVALLCSDAQGNARPSTGAWDQGWLNFGSAPPPAATPPWIIFGQLPDAPTNLRTILE